MCGLIGIFGHPRAAKLAYHGLLGLQHRGQESAGMVVCRDGRFKAKHGMGLVGQVFAAADLEALSGAMAVAHTRYSTFGVSQLKNAQPLLAECSHGPVAVAHNGTLTNGRKLRDDYGARGAIFQTTTDSEVILHIISHLERGPWDEVLLRALAELEGAYSLLLVTPRGVVGVRDPFGWRPLVLGRLEHEQGTAYLLASETCALEMLGAEVLREVAPGEAVFLTEQGPSFRRFADPAPSPRPCLFELVYFARPDSVVFGDTVHEVRKSFGRRLAREHPVEADVVIPVPDSGTSAAIGYAEESGIRLDAGFVRSHYVGRSFIEPYQVLREAAARTKLSVVRSVVQGKRVIVVDDSIVRGTTCRARIRDLRAAGAKQVHLRISCPPHRHPCWYGIDFPDPAQLIAVGREPADIAAIVGADSLGYLSLQGMRSCASGASYCTSCWTGEYPAPAGVPANEEAVDAN